jgi:hypothetical protein
VYFLEATYVQNISKDFNYATDECILLSQKLREIIIDCANGTIFEAPKDRAPRNNFGRRSECQPAKLLNIPVAGVRGQAGVDTIIVGPDFARKILQFKKISVFGRMIRGEPLPLNNGRFARPRAILSSACPGQEVLPQPL